MLHSAQISHDWYNTYVIIENNVCFWLCQLKKHTGNRYLQITSTSTSTFTNTPTPHKAPKSRRSKMNIRHICNHRPIITKMALW